MTTQANKLYFYRSPDEESMDAITKLQKDIAGIQQNFRPTPRSRAHATICDIRFREGENHAATGLKKLARSLLTDFDNPSAPITWGSLGYIKGHISKTALVIDLANPKLVDECQLITGAVSNRVISAIVRSTPHMTLGYIDPEHATSTLLQKASERVAETTRSTVFSQIRYDLKGLKFINNDFFDNEIVLARLEKYAAQHSTDSVPVRHIMPHSIPQHFLDTLRPQTSGSEPIGQL